MLKLNKVLFIHCAADMDSTWLHINNLKENCKARSLGWYLAKRAAANVKLINWPSESHNSMVGRMC